MAIKGIADITPFMPESVRGWLKENGQILPNNLRLSWMKYQSGRYACVSCPRVVESANHGIKITGYA